MKRVILVNPPVYDFSAFDFWMKPYGLLKIGRALSRNGFSVELFDFMDRFHPSVELKWRINKDEWGRGKFPFELVKKPEVLREIKRKYKRFGVKGKEFEKFLRERKDAEAMLVTCTMTYWYPGVEEVINTVKRINKKILIIIGGNYAKLCFEHAREKFSGENIYIIPSIKELENYLGINFSDVENEVAFWELYDNVPYGVIRLTYGCPMKCTYCSAGGYFKPLDPEVALEEFKLLKKRGVKNIVFYDDALLEGDYIYRFFEKLEGEPGGIFFHTPNGLSSKGLTFEKALNLYRWNFKNIFLGFEFGRNSLHRLTGLKTSVERNFEAIENLRKAGFKNSHITLYLMCGHPLQSEEDLLYDVEVATSTGVRIMLSDFSPVPETPDGERAMKEFKITDPLLTNKTAFVLMKYSENFLQKVKNMVKEHNRKIS